MVVNRKVSGTVSGIPGGLITGLCAGLLTTTAGCGLTAWLLHAERLSENSIGYMSLLILLLSAFTGASVTWKRIRHRKLFVCMLAGVLYYGTLLCITGLFFGGQFQGMGVTAAAVLAGTLLAAIPGRSGRRKHRTGRLKI